jgi:uncharacterized membrane protein
MTSIDEKLITWRIRFWKMIYLMLVACLVVGIMTGVMVSMTVGLVTYAILVVTGMVLSVIRLCYEMDQSSS